MAKSKEINLSAPGKIILSGEHAVVYGYPALLSAVNKRLRVNESLKVSSEIPIGCGMGSSAAYSVAISAMKIRLQGNKFNKRQVSEMAYQMEKRYHGNPSGADIATCTYGGYIWFRKESEVLKLITKIEPKKKFPDLFIHNTGKPVETTREMVVDVVGRKYIENQDKTEAIFIDIEKNTKSFLRYITNTETIDLRELVSANERLLEELGVVSASTVELIKHIEKIGGVAKITGAGGRKTASGLLLIYHPEKEALISFFEKQQLNHTEIKLDEGGLTID